MSDPVQLVNQKGATSTHIDVKLEENGDLQFSGQDIGEAPAEAFGDSDYEYWLTISAADKDALLLALIEEHYAGDESVISKVQRLLESKKIRAEFFSY